MCLGLSNAISHLILITAEKGELFWSTGKWKNSGQWDDVRRITQQVNDSRDSHSALPTGSPPTGLRGSNVFLTLRTLETIITSYFWWAKKGCFRAALIPPPTPCFACSTTPETENGRFLPKSWWRSKGQVCGRRRGAYLQSLLLRGKKAHLMVKTLLLGLKLTPTTYITVFLFNQCSATRISYIQSSERAIKKLIKNS